MVSAQTRTWRDEAGQSPIIKDVHSSLLKHVMNCLFLIIIRPLNTRLIFERQLTNIPPTVDRYTTSSRPIYHRQLTDIPPTVDWYTTDSWPIYHRHMADSKSRCVVEISTDTRPIVYLAIDRPSTDYRPTIDRLSTDCRPTIDRYIDRYVDRYLGRHYPQ